MNKFQSSNANVTTTDPRIKQLVAEYYSNEDLKKISDEKRREIIEKLKGYPAPVLGCSKAHGP